MLKKMKESRRHSPSEISPAMPGTPLFRPSATNYLLAGRGVQADIFELLAKPNTLIR